jgi:hypothetical protein
LLCCDAWFDVLLDARTKGFEVSLLSAVVIELPLAALAILGARRLLRLTSVLIGYHAGLEGPQPRRLRDIPLLGMGPESHLRDLLADPSDARPASADRDPPGG